MRYLEECRNLDVKNHSTYCAGKNHNRLGDSLNKNCYNLKICLSHVANGLNIIESIGNMTKTYL